MQPEIPYTISYRNIKYPRLEFKTGMLKLILPRNYEKKDILLEKHKQWITKKQQEIQNAISQTSIKSLNTDRTLPQLRELIAELVLSSQKQLKTTINKIFFKKMKTKWASHSKNHSLTINTSLKYLPNDLIEYIVFHETAHGIERKHNQLFWNLIKNRFADYEAKERDLFTYWFLIQQIQ